MTYKTDGSDGFDFSQPNQTYSIDYGILVGSETAFGVKSAHSGSSLENYGTILSGAAGSAGIGVYFLGTSDGMHNGGRIVGQQGIVLEGANAFVQTWGTVEGLNGYAIKVGAAADDFDLKNEQGGLIDGKGVAVYVGNTAVGGLIENKGVITAEPDQNSQNDYV